MEQLNPLEDNISPASPLAAPAPAPKKHRAKKVVLWIVGTLAVLVIVFLFLPSVLSLFNPDIEHINDEDLALKVVDISNKDDNAFYDLIKLDDLPKDTSGLSAFPFSPSTTARLSDKAFMDAFLGDYHAAFETFDNATHRSYFQEPYSANPLLPLDQRLPQMSNWRWVARMEAVRARYLATTGTGTEAMRVAMDSAALAEKMLESPQPTLIAYLVGLAHKNIALEAITTIMSSSTVSKADSKVFTSELETMKDTSQGLAAAFRHEYQSGKAGLMKPIDDSAIKGAYDAPILLVGSARKYYFQRNATISLIAEDYRRMISGALESCMFARKEGDYTHYYEMLDRPWLMYFEKNLIGEMLARVVDASFSSVFDRRCADISHVSATQTLIAIRAYKKDTGSLPQTLDQLVPEYIAKVPDDPFSGKPMIYDPTRKIIYSIGNNRINDGGTTGVNTDWYAMKDQVIEIPF